MEVEESYPKVSSHYYESRSGRRIVSMGYYYLLSTLPYYYYYVCVELSLESDNNVTKLGSFNLFSLPPLTMYVGNWRVVSMENGDLVYDPTETTT